MKHISLLFTIFIFFINNANAQWQTIFKDSVNYQFNTVHFLNSDTGFVGGYNLTMSGSHNGIIFRTKDGGITWDTTNLNELIICIHFIDDSFGFSGGDGGADYLTTDLGDSWQQRGFSSTMSDHSSIYFVNPSLGYRSTMQSWIQKTIDTGMTWQNVFNSTGGSYFPGTSRMVFPDSQIGYLAQSRNTPSGNSSISKTSDGGNTWSDLLIPANFHPYSCFFFDTLYGWAVGRYGKISKTTDGGATWTSPLTISNYFLYDISFVNDSIGYIVGGFNQYDTSSLRKGIIFKTIDSGNSWQVMDSSYFDGLTKLHFPNDSVGYAVGFNGIILKINNANSIISAVETIAGTNTFMNIYPNPASDFLNIEIPANEKVEVINSLGEILIVKEPASEWTNQVKLDVSCLAPGLYFIKTSQGVNKFIKD